MIKKYLLILSIIGSILYGGFTFYSNVINNKYPYFIECMGIKLDHGDSLLVSNNSMTNSLNVDYPQGMGLIPNNIGVFRNINGEISLYLNDKIHDSTKDLKHPFYAIVRDQNTSYFKSGRYYGPNSIVKEADLINGIKINSPFGDRASRVPIRVIKFAGNKYISIPSEGIKVKYPVEAGQHNKFGVCFKTNATYQIPNVFRFEKSTRKEKTVIIDATVKSFREAECRVQNKIYRGQNFMFEVEGLCFSVTPRYNFVTMYLFIFTYFIVLAFQIYLFLKCWSIKSPLIFSLLNIRLQFNNLFLLGAPIFLIATQYTSNRWVYLVSILLINLSYFVPKTLLHDFKFIANKQAKIIMICSLVILPIVMVLKNSNEALFGVPILHYQKILTLILIYFSQSMLFRSYRLNFWAKMIVFIGYSFILSFITHDLGSLIYTSSALILVETLKGNISKRSILLLLGSGIIILSLLYFIAPGAFSGKKLYRIAAPYTSPASAQLVDAPQADRETYTNLHLIQKLFMNVDLPSFENVSVPLSMRSTSFSDFAFFWSLVYGKIIFLILFFCVVYLLIDDLLLLLYACLRPMRINQELSFILPQTKEAAYTAFLLAFSLVTFLYPIFSNLMIVPLTGQSLPFISISTFEGFYYLIFIILLGSIFTNPNYIFKTNTIKYTYSKVLASKRKNWIALTILLVPTIIFKLYNIYTMPESFIWNKKSNERQNQSTIIMKGTSKGELEIQAKSYIGEDNITYIPKKKKLYLRQLSSLYFINKSYEAIKPEAKRFENNLSKVNFRLNVDSLYTLRMWKINGKHAPFGEVTAYEQRVNNEITTSYSNRFYNTISREDKTVNPDFTAELNKLLEAHIKSIGIKTNAGAILVVDNANGEIMSNACYPIANKNQMYIPYLAGSVKKVILGFSALAVDLNYFYKEYEGISFTKFLEKSDDVYAASLLRDLMLNHQEKFREVLFQDFNLPLTSRFSDAYFDQLPDNSVFTKPLDNTNYLYRISIGQEKPYTLLDITQWYARICSGKKLNLTNQQNKQDHQSLTIGRAELSNLQQSLHRVLTSGTAANVGNYLRDKNIESDDFFGKTGTAQQENSNRNVSSSFIMCTPGYTISIMLRGNLPENHKGYAAKDLMQKMIPILRKYSYI